jgi:hypothetical protein
MDQHQEQEGKGEEVTSLDDVNSQLSGIAVDPGSEIGEDVQKEVDNRDADRDLDATPEHETPKGSSEVETPKVTAANYVTVKATPIVARSSKADEEDTNSSPKPLSEEEDEDDHPMAQSKGPETVKGRRTSATEVVIPHRSQTQSPAGIQPSDVPRPMSSKSTKSSSSSEVAVVVEKSAVENRNKDTKGKASIKGLPIGNGKNAKNAKSTDDLPLVVDGRENVSPNYTIRSHSLTRSNRRFAIAARTSPQRQASCVEAHGFTSQRSLAGRSSPAVDATTQRAAARSTPGPGQGG